jgi:alpha-beta hydrolase superfamily lysophospholipase
MLEGVSKVAGETKPNEMLQKLIFGSYNKKVEHPRTTFDWLTRDDRIVDAYIAHPLCGFTASAGLMREMIRGIHYIQQKGNLEAMNKQLPVFFIAGGDDPVGPYGKGVHTCAEAFRTAGMEDVSVRIYPLCRHEILNEINREQVYHDVLKWVEKYL